ncbi:MAG TPA: hypothetical protein VFV81_01550 [Verrucomicrobiae bacterium]|nr:hypothetical protein [Verrucomicrobiae bacterium]
MSMAANSISTRAKGWEEQCRTWADTGQSFEVRDLEESHFMFCQRLCAKYDYVYKYRCRGPESVAVFEALE